MVKKRKVAQHLFSFLIIFIISFVLLNRLFLPTSNLLVTPDFGLSDSWSKSIADKYFLWESIRSGHLPVWSSLIGQGTPILAEGQIGTFFLPNLIFPILINYFPLYYNLLLILTALTFGFGLYLWINQLTQCKTAAIYAASTGILSGIFIPHLTHLTLLQSLSLIPWMFYIVNRLNNKKTLLNFLLLSLITSQQIFSGFPQIVFITFIFIFIDSIIIYWLKKINLSQIITTGISLLFGIVLSSAQLFPNIEFRNSLPAKGEYAGNTSMHFSCPFNHLITILDPFLKGNPKFGSYPSFIAYDGSIFWENSAYIGIFPLILFVLWSLLNKKIKQETKLKSYPLLFIFFFSFLLMTGKYSPIYFVHTFFPFNLFRVPSRFITIFVISLLTISSLTLSHVLTNLKQSIHSLIIYLIIFIHIISLIFIWIDYHVFYPSDKWMEMPEMISELKKANFIKTIGYGKLHNETYLSKGWQNVEPFYEFRKYLEPNSNLIWHISQSDSYRGRVLYRNSIFESAVNQELKYSSSSAQISLLGLKLIKLSGTDYLIGPYEISNLKISDQNEDYRYPMYLYRFNDTLPLIYQAKQTHTALSLDDALSILEQDEFKLGNDVISETEFPISSVSASISDIEIDKYTGDAILFIDAAEKNTLIVYNQTYYPGWKVFIDDQPKQILPINIRFQGVLVPSGKHNIKWFFAPDSVKKGLIISISAYLTIIVIALKVLRKVV